MMAPDNIFLPSSGKPSAVPSQDMILGLYYLMLDPYTTPEEKGRPLKTFKNMDEVLMALNSGGSFNWFESKGREGRCDDLGPRNPLT